MLPGHTDQLTHREEMIAQRAAEIAIERVAAKIGATVVQKFVWLIGALALGLFGYFGGFHK